MLKPLVAAVALPLLTACAAAADENASAQARAAFDAYVAAINNGDVDTAASLYDRDPDFHWVEKGELRYTSADAAVESMTGLLAMGGMPLMTVNEVLVADLGDDAALVTANFNFVMLGEDKTPMFGFDGWISTAIVRREDGWKIAAGQSGPANTGE